MSPASAIRRALENIRNWHSPDGDTRASDEVREILIRDGYAWREKGGWTLTGKGMEFLRGAP